MGFLGFGKRRDILDLTEKYRKNQERIAEIQEETSTPNTSTDSSSGGFGFFNNMASAASASNTTEETSDVSVNPDERKRKLSKKLLEMTEKIEDLSNQIYHLQQRLEVLERKSGVGGY